MNDQTSTQSHRERSASMSDQDTALAFTVVLPTYRGRPSVTRSVASILRQTYPAFELIVVTDGDGDATRQLLAELSDPRLTVVTQPPSGVSRARNLGITLAHHDWVTFLDDDDLARPTFLDTWARLINPGTIAVTGGISYRQSGKPEVIRQCHLSLTDETIGASTVLAGGFAIRRDLLQVVGGYDECLRAAENQDLGLRVCDHLIAHGSKGHILHTDEIVADVIVEHSATRSTRYITAQADSASIFLERYARRLSGAPRQKATLLRIISRSKRWERTRRGAWSASLEACRLEPRNPENWRSLALAVAPHSVTALRDWQRRLRRHHGHT